MPHLLQIFSQSDYLFQVADISLHIMSNSADPGQLASEESSWCGFALFPKTAYKFSWTRVNCFSIGFRIFMYFCIKSSIGTRVKLASCKSALNPSVVCSTDRSKAVVPVLVLLFVALWFILRGDLLYVFPCVILFLCFSVLLVLRLPCLGKRELILVLLVRLFGLCLFRFVGFLFLLGSGKGWGLWLWHSLDFSLTFLFHYSIWRNSDLHNIPWLPTLVPTNLTLTN